MFTENNFTQAIVDAASAFASVCAYHPCRTVASALMAKTKVSYKPTSLYTGFAPALMGSHQLFLMNYMYHKNAKTKDKGDVIVALASGLASAPSMTLCEGFVVRKQNKISCNLAVPKEVFRGFTPMVFRQMGASLGMFVFPKWLETTYNRTVSEKYTNYPNKSAFVLTGGAAAAVVTQYPDTLRVVMQTNPSMKMQKACQEAFRRMLTPDGLTACTMRVGVLSIAFTVMKLSRENLSKILIDNKGE